MTQFSLNSDTRLPFATFAEGSGQIAQPTTNPVSNLHNTLGTNFAFKITSFDLLTMQQFSACSMHAYMHAAYD